MLFLVATLRLWPRSLYALRANVYDISCVEPKSCREILWCIKKVNSTYKVVN